MNFLIFAKRHGIVLDDKLDEPLYERAGLKYLKDRSTKYAVENSAGL